MRRYADTPQEYIDQLDDKQKALLLEIRGVIFEVEPDADEILEEKSVLSYPGIAHIAAQKHSVNMYVSQKALAAYKKKNPKANAGKCCLRFGSLHSFDRSAVKTLFEDIRKIREAGGSVDCCE